VRNRKDIENILKTFKTLTSKKDKLRDQLLYCKHFFKFRCSNNTLSRFKLNLTLVLKLDKAKPISIGTWVAVSFEDDWYPGEVLEIKSQIIVVKFMVRQKKGGVTFKWPTKDGIRDVDLKFAIFSNFDILPSPGLRHWLIQETDDIIYSHKKFVEKYF